MKKPKTVPAADREGSPPGPRGVRAGGLFDELRRVRARLRKEIEERETAGRELAAANEAVVSHHEELHRTVEELDTARAELRCANEELDKRAARLSGTGGDLSRLLSSMRVPVVMVGRDLRVRRFTPRAGKDLGLTEWDVGRPLRNLRPMFPDLRFEKLAAGVMKRVGTRELEVQDLRGNWRRIRLTSYSDSGKGVDGAVLVITDMDSLKCHQTELEAARDFAYATVNAVGWPLVVLNDRFLVNTANRAFHELFGVQEGKALGRPLFKLGSGLLDRTDLREFLEEALRGEPEGGDHKFHIRLPAGGGRTFKLRTRPLDCCEQKLILLCFSDVSVETEESRHSLDVLRRRELDLKTITDNVPVMIAYVDSDHRYRFVNRNYANLLAKEPRDIIGRHARLVLGARTYARIRPRLESAMRGNRVRFEINLSLPQGRLCWFQASYVPDMEESGRGRGVFALLNDITERKEAEETKTIQERDNLLREFFANVSHEFRTPIATVKAAMEELERLCPHQDKRHRRLHVTVNRHADRLMRLVDKMLHLSAYSDSTRRIRRESFAISGLARGCAQEVSPLVKKAGLRTNCRIVPRLRVRANKEQVKLVLQNLLENAIQYNRPGGLISIKLEDLGGRAMITVSDTGVGMAEEDLGKVFQRHYRTPQGRRMAPGGSGLGLALVKAIVKSHGGRVWVQSSPGKGSSFSFTLPVS